MCNSNSLTPLKVQSGVFRGLEAEEHLQAKRGLTEGQTLGNRSDRGDDVAWHHIPKPGEDLHVWEG